MQRAFSFLNQLMRHPFGGVSCGIFRNLGSR